MNIEGPLIPGVFIERPNRFITKVLINGEIVTSHLPDPGRLKELLFEGAKVLLRPASNNSKRKTKFSTVMVNHKGQLISLVSTLPNQFVLESLKNNSLPMFKNFQLIKPEVVYGNHRFDFLLKDKGGKHFYLEVKSVTYVQNRLAKFPDAITERGTKHAKTLTQLTCDGYGTGILFVCQRPDADRFEPMWERDYKFGSALFDASKAGVNIWCITTNLSETEMTLNNVIPVNLSYPRVKKNII
ncbi:MAG: DNA/RNA nuclease SfsA [Fidelibacterota bacterium]|jgi:sugar fermentation stimulation protein A|nr:DNA/RNA nuclease SfsA [Candidatus Neomarinimicrobiota bacterium]|tara:strand:+ start:1450 stop:2175 length:726 start_codon:yes stop_codon:yes gene_type:complete